MKLKAAYYLPRKALESICLRTWAAGFKVNIKKVSTRDIQVICVVAHPDELNAVKYLFFFSLVVTH